MKRKNLDLTKYTGDSVGLIGLNTEFKLCHIPFLVENDVFGAFALQGSSGTGKTTIAKKLGILNQLANPEQSWGIYSADKARYEDFVGCPIPNPTTGEMKIFPMPNSISTKTLILIDEINRATYENQEKWLSLIATREIDGFHSKTRYIFTAMNPVMSTDSNDMYEGVQPLDKAMGERMIGLVDVPSLGKIHDSVKRKEIIKAAINQTNWAPSDDLVELHILFLQRAREIYEQAKNTYLEHVVEYVDTIQSSLRKESKNSISIEARRAQFILINILANYALNAVTQGESQSTLQSSALSALLCSFPNTLWEQPISLPALKQAHKDASNCLVLPLETLKSGALNSSDLDKVLSEIHRAVEEGVEKEYVSKLINQSIPPKEINPFSHFAFMFSVRAGLTKGGLKHTQTLMKAQEFSRFDNFYKTVINSPTYEKYKNLAKELKNSTNKHSFITKNYPTYVGCNVSCEEDFKAYSYILESDVSWVALTIIEDEKLNITSYEELYHFTNSILEASNAFIKLNNTYDSKKS